MGVELESLPTTDSSKACFNWVSAQFLGSGTSIPSRVTAMMWLLSKGLFDPEERSRYRVSVIGNSVTLPLSRVRTRVPRPSTLGRLIGEPFSDLAHSFKIGNTFEQVGIVFRQPIVKRNLGDVVPRLKFSRTILCGLHLRSGTFSLTHLRLL